MDKEKSIKHHHSAEQPPCPHIQLLKHAQNKDNTNTLQKAGTQSESAALSARAERESNDFHKKKDGCDAKKGSLSLFSVPSGSGSGSIAHQTKVFSLSQKSKLVVKSDGKGKDFMSRVRGRGRGWCERLGPPQVGASRQSRAGNGITVIEPSEKRLVQEQSEGAAEDSTFGSPGLLMSDKMEPLQYQQDQTNESLEEGEGKSEDSIPPPRIVMQTSPMQVSKPKHYSSQWQKFGKSGEQQQWGQQQGAHSLSCCS